MNTTTMPFNAPAYSGAAASTAGVREVEVAILGAGFGGLCMAIQLQKAGINDYLILEKASEVGGAWRDNHYPGAACDVQSHMYSYSFETKSDWTQRYAPWHEIQQYILDTVTKYRLRPKILFNQEVDSAVFNEQTGKWTVKTQGGITLVARHFVIASGPLHVPAFPDIKGLDTFKGKSCIRPSGTTATTCAASVWRLWAQVAAPSSTCLKLPPRWRSCMCSSARLHG